MVSRIISDSSGCVPKSKQLIETGQKCFANELSTEDYTKTSSVVNKTTIKLASEPERKLPRYPDAHKAVTLPRGRESVLTCGRHCRLVE